MFSSVLSQLRCLVIPHPYSCCGSCFFDAGEAHNLTVSSLVHDFSAFVPVQDYSPISELREFEAYEYFSSMPRTTYKVNTTKTILKGELVFAPLVFRNDAR